MRMIGIGIDPGATGGIAVISNGKVVQLSGMPTMAKLRGTGEKVNSAALADILRDAMDVASFSEDTAAAAVFLEQVGNMPRKNKFGQDIKMGATSMFNFGKNVGAIDGVTGALGLPVNEVTPQAWKKKAGIIGKDKDAARTLAIQLHPEVADRLKFKKNCGLADAILIAHFSMDK